jgi:hypothetical protein
MLGWGYLLAGLHGHVADFAPWALVAGLLLVVVLAGYWLNRHHRPEVD